jgi:hypothetical protein
MLAMYMSLLIALIVTCKSIGAALTNILVRTCTDSNGQEYIAVYEWYISLIHLIVGLCTYYGLRKTRNWFLVKHEKNEEGAS